MDTTSEINLLTNLYRCDGTLLSCCNSFLHATHVSCKRGLVTDSRWNTTKKSRYLRTSLSKSENIVDEKKYVLTLLVTEILSNSETSQSNTGTSAWGLIHLSIDERHLEEHKALQNNFSDSQKTMKFIVTDKP